MALSVYIRSFLFPRVKLGLFPRLPPFRTGSRSVVRCGQAATGALRRSSFQPPPLRRSPLFPDLATGASSLCTPERLTYAASLLSRCQRSSVIASALAVQPSYGAAAMASRIAESTTASSDMDSAAAASWNSETD